MSEDPGGEDLDEGVYSLADLPPEVFIADISHDEGCWHWRMDTKPLVHADHPRAHIFGRRRRSPTTVARGHEIEVRDGTPPARAVSALAHCSRRCALLDPGPTRDELTQQLASLHRVVWAMVEVVAVQASIDRRRNQMPPRPELDVLTAQRQRGEVALKAMTARFEALVELCDELADLGGSDPFDKGTEVLLTQAVRAVGAGRAAEEILHDVCLHVSSLDQALIEVSEAES